MLNTPIAGLGLGQRIAESDSWDSDATGDTGTISVPAGTLFVDVSISTKAYILVNKLSAVPTVDGAWYNPGTYRFACKGGTYIHYKNFTPGDNVTLNATAYKQDI